MSTDPEQAKPGWIADRFALTTFAYHVPRHANTLPYTLGGIALVSFLLLAATGTVLAQWYEPGAMAHASTADVTSGRVLGVVRSAHFWLATIFIGAVVLHLLRTYVYGAFKDRREGLWLSGVALFALSGAALYSGTLLKWDQEAGEALAHTKELAQLIGLPALLGSGGDLSLLIRGYVSHVSVIPLIFLGAVGLHAIIIRHLGISPEPWGDPVQIEQHRAAEPDSTFIRHLAHLGWWTVAVSGAAILLAALFPIGLGPEATPGLEVTKPPWYFLWVYPFENWFGLKALVIAPFVMFAALAIIPFVDRSAQRDPRRRKRWVALAVFTIVAVIGLSVYGFFSTPAEHVGMTKMEEKAG